MSSPQDKVPIQGSYQSHPADARLVQAVDPGEVMDVSVYVRPRSPQEAREQAEALASLPVSQRQYPSRQAYAAAHGADPRDMEAVEAFARAHGLEVKEANAAERRLVLSGPAQALARAFHVSLGQYEAGGKQYRGTSGPAHVPAALAPIVEAVVGLDNRPHARRQDRFP